jgi:predicted dehydrogenase
VRDKVLYRRKDAVAPPTGSAWRYQLAGCGAGELSENGVHQVDLARHLCGEIARCSGLMAQLQPLQLDGPDGSKVPSETSDTYFALLRFVSGAIGQTGLSAAAHGEGSPVRENFRVHGENGSVSESRYELRNGSAGDPWDLFASEAPRALRDRWFPAGLTHRFALHKLDMLEAIRERRDPLTSGQSGLVTLAACCAIAESSLLGREVVPADLLELRPSAFQDPIDRALGLLPAPAGASVSGAVSAPDADSRRSAAPGARPAG